MVLLKNIVNTTIRLYTAVEDQRCLMYILLQTHKVQFIIINLFTLKDTECVKQIFYSLRDFSYFNFPVLSKLPVIYFYVLVPHVYMLGLWD